MEDRRINLHLGIGAIIGSVLLLAVLIPTWVSSPSNVPNIVLSPLMWPNAIAVVTGLIGLALVASAFRMPKPDAPAPSDIEEPAKGYLRLLAMAVIMVVTMLLMPRLGLVWTSMIVFALTAFLVHTSHPVTALICAVCVPLVLYLFFAHVAGVAIPQGIFVRLP